MKKQFFAKRWCLGFGMMMAVTACQPKAAEAQRNPSSSSHSHDGYNQGEDDDGDDGTYGSGDESTQILEETDSSLKDHTASASSETSDTTAQKQEMESSEEIVFSDGNQSAQASTPAELETIASVENGPSLDPRLEAVEAIRIISENYQEIANPSSEE